MVVILLLLISFLLLISCVYSKTFDWATGNTAVWLSAAAYCETNTYLSRTFIGYSSGFIVTDVINNQESDVQVNNIKLKLYLKNFCKP